MQDARYVILTLACVSILNDDLKLLRLFLIVIALLLGQQIAKVLVKDLLRHRWSVLDVLSISRDLRVVLLQLENERLLLYGNFALVLLPDSLLAGFSIIFVASLQVINFNAIFIELDPIFVSQPVLILGLEFSLARSRPMPGRMEPGTVRDSRYLIEILLI